MRILDWGKKRRAFNVVAFDATGRMLAAGGDYQPTVVWDVVTEAERARFDACPASREMSFQPRTGKLVLSTPVGMRLCDIDTGAMTAPDDSIRALIFAPNEDRAVFCRKRLNQFLWELHAVARFGEPDQATVWSASVGDASDESGYVFTLACLSGDRFASAERVDAPEPHRGRFRIAVRSWADGRLLQASPNHAVGYSDGLFAAPVCDAVVVQDAAQLRIHPGTDLQAPPLILKNARRKHFTGVAFHPSGRYLAVTSNDKTVKLFDLTTWDAVKAFTWDIGKMRSIAFSSDGTLAAAGSDSGKVVIWDVDF